jgi:protoporphyrinogen/coproporphyrinogen III oxidase
MPHVVVVGGGIAGAATAWYLRQAAREDLPELLVTVVEGGSRVGGKLRSADLAGTTVDTGAEAILNRRPEGVDLARAVGLGDLIRHPATTAANLWSRGALRPIPAGTVMGIPGDLAALELSGVLSTSGLARVAQEPDIPGAPTEGDVAVGAYAAARLGREAVDRLVEPLLGGVYAGRADQLSLQATVPALVPYLREDPSLVRAAARAKAAAPNSDAPVFAGLDGGVAALVPKTLAASGARVRTDAMVRELRRLAGSDRPEAPLWQLVVGPTARPEIVDANGVVLACPARPASRLLADVAPAAARELGAIEYASTATVALAFPAGAVRGTPADPASGSGSGFLVPPTEPTVIKAATFASAKWPWLVERAPDLVVVRCSVGRIGEEADLHRDDDELVAAAVADLRAATGISAAPVDALVARWGGGLPQYAVGHRERVGRIRADVAAHPGLALAGAAYDGIGIPACVAGARAAATQVLDTMRCPGRMTA